MRADYTARERSDMANAKIEAGVYLDIHEATAYAGRPIQVSVNKLDADGGGHGYRIAGPKFTLSGARLLRRVRLDARAAAEIRRYLDMVEPAAGKTPTTATDFDKWWQAENESELFGSAESCREIARAAFERGYRDDRREPAEDITDRHGHYQAAESGGRP